MSTGMPAYDWVDDESLDLKEVRSRMEQLQPARVVDFYEEDEPPDTLRAAFARGEKQVTRRPE